MQLSELLLPTLRIKIISNKAGYFTTEVSVVAALIMAGGHWDECYPYRPHKLGEYTSANSHLDRCFLRHTGVRYNIFDARRLKNAEMQRMLSTFVYYFGDDADSMREHALRVASLMPSQLLQQACGGCSRATFSGDWSAIVRACNEWYTRLRKHWEASTITLSVLDLGRAAYMSAKQMHDDLVVLKMYPTLGCMVCKTRCLLSGEHLTYPVVVKPKDSVASEISVIETERDKGSVPEEGHTLAVRAYGVFNVWIVEVDGQPVKHHEQIDYLAEALATHYSERYGPVVVTANPVLSWEHPHFEVSRVAPNFTWLRQGRPALALPYLACRLALTVQHMAHMLMTEPQRNGEYYAHRLLDLPQPLSRYLTLADQCQRDGLVATALFTRTLLTWLAAMVYNLRMPRVLRALLVGVERSDVVTVMTDAYEALSRNAFLYCIGAIVKTGCTLPCTRRVSDLIAHLPDADRTHCAVIHLTAADVSFDDELMDEDCMVTLGAPYRTPPVAEMILTPREDEISPFRTVYKHLLTAAHAD
jgi:hypothetical protein